MTEIDTRRDPKRVVMRITALCCIGLAAILLIAEWFAGTLGLAPGALGGAGLVLCIAGNLVTALLVAARRRG